MLTYEEWVKRPTIDMRVGGIETLGRYIAGERVISTCRLCGSCIPDIWNRPDDPVRHTHDAWHEKMHRMELLADRVDALLGRLEQGVELGRLLELRDELRLGSTAV